MKTIIYLSTALTEEKYNFIVKKCNSFKPTYSGVGFDSNILIGLSNKCNLISISYMPIPSYPKYKSIVENQDFIKFNNVLSFVPKIFAIPKIKEIQFGKSVISYTKTKLLETVNQDVVILCSGIYSCFLKPAIQLKKKYGYPVFVIVPDVPEIMRNYRKDHSSIKRWLIEKDINYNKHLRTNIDGFIFLSSPMNNLLNFNNKPHIIIDGICNLSSIEHEFEEISNEKFVLYAGKVSREFGIDKLVEAFEKVETKYKLYICGDGDYSEELKNKYLKNVVYKGLISHQEILKMEKKALLLIDPRPSNLILSKFSFPSKIIEYMASGTPVLNTNLPCFGPDYSEFHYRFQDESVEGMAKTITELLSKDPIELKNMGIKAQKYILENKTIHHQCNKIIEFITKTHENNN